MSFSSYHQCLVPALCEHCSKMDWKVLCSTCGIPYSKVPVFQAAICSNGFHCCRDCVWENGRRTTICEFHLSEERDEGVY